MGPTRSINACAGTVTASCPSPRDCTTAQTAVKNGISVTTNFGKWDRSTSPTVIYWVISHSFTRYCTLNTPTGCPGSRVGSTTAPSAPHSPSPRPLTRLRASSTSTPATGSSASLQRAHPARAYSPLVRRATSIRSTATRSTDRQSARDYTGSPNLAFERVTQAASARHIYPDTVNTVGIVTLVDPQDA